MNTHSVDTFIMELEDSSAVRILSTIARSHTKPDDKQIDFTPELHKALGSGIKMTGSEGPVSDGDVARHALLLLAQEAEMRSRIKVLAETRPPEKFIEPALTITLTAALIFVLKTSGGIRRDENGKLTWEVNWKAMDNESLKRFVEKLLSWIPSGPY